MTVEINGVDITSYIAIGGFKWSRNDVDGPNAGRTLAGLMDRDRIATKIRLDITCRPLRIRELNTVLNLIMPEYVQVTYDDPLYGRRTATMYSNNNPASYSMTKYGVEWWDGVTFPLVER